MIEGTENEIQYWEPCELGFVVRHTLEPVYKGHPTDWEGGIVVCHTLKPVYKVHPRYVPERVGLCSLMYTGTCL